ncbi:MAG: hypothetical protein HYZ53_25150 [Planctomycetes bacterium]|nr:hypothetical protein [Planctomycetota bacterium]
MPEFLLLLRGDKHIWSTLSEDEQLEILQRYRNWVDLLRSQNQYRAGAATDDGGRFLHVVNGSLVETQYADTCDVVTGYFVIEAPDLDAAAGIAQHCPGLSHGESILVRPLT